MWGSSASEKRALTWRRFSVAAGLEACTWFRVRVRVRVRGRVTVRVGARVRVRVRVRG